MQKNAVPNPAGKEQITISLFCLQKTMDLLEKPKSSLQKSYEIGIYILSGKEQITVSLFCSQKTMDLLEKPKSEFPTLLYSNVYLGCCG